jgi:hypothetical protein
MKSHTFAAYDSFVSLLAQYQREEITQVARLAEQKLVAEVIAAGGRNRSWFAQQERMSEHGANHSSHRK